MRETRKRSALLSKRGVSLGRLIARTETGISSLTTREGRAGFRAVEPPLIRWDFVTQTQLLGTRGWCQEQSASVRWHREAQSS